jgi:hypothetical protein
MMFDCTYHWKLIWHPEINPNPPEDTLLYASYHF